MRFCVFVCRYSKIRAVGSQFHSFRFATCPSVGAQNKNDDNGENYKLVSYSLPCFVDCVLPFYFDKLM